MVCAATCCAVGEKTHNEGERKLVLEWVLEVFNTFESCATNIKYPLNKEYQRVMINLLVHCMTECFSKLQRIHHSLLPILSPVTLEALAATRWLPGALPKGMKAEDPGSDLGAETCQTT